MKTSKPTLWNRWSTRSTGSDWIQLDRSCWISRGLAWFGFQRCKCKRCKEKRREWKNMKIQTRNHFSSLLVTGHIFLRKEIAKACADAISIKVRGAYWELIMGYRGSIHFGPYSEESVRIVGGSQFWIIYVFSEAYFLRFLQPLIISHAKI